MGEHTKGPWFVVDRDQSIGSVEDADGNAVAQAQIRGSLRAPANDERKANAHLISAAPDLLEALEEIRAFTGIMFGRGMDADIPETVTVPLGLPVKLGDIVRSVDAAIAKARGQ